MMTAAEYSSRPTASPAGIIQQSPWHSPIPYLFGGLAAMLGLIAFALLILACSYWKLSGYLDGGENGSGERDLESGADKEEKPKLPPVWEEKILVIMAGQQKPTFLATPVTSRASSFGSNSSSCTETAENLETEKPKQGSEEDQVHTADIESQESSDQNH